MTKKKIAATKSGRKLYVERGEEYEDAYTEKELVDMASDDPDTWGSRVFVEFVETERLVSVEIEVKARLESKS